MNTTQTSTSQCQVLIVGAGPTGLVLAAQLLARGVRTRIVDKGEGPARQSRAVSIYARARARGHHGAGGCLYFAWPPGAPIALVRRQAHPAEPRSGTQWLTIRLCPASPSERNRAAAASTRARSGRCYRAG